MNELNDLTAGTTLNECVAAFPNELQVDAVGLWQVVNTLRRRYGLQEPELAVHVRKSIEGLLAAGAVPVVGSSKDNLWHVAAGFDQHGEDRTEALLRYLEALGRDPDVGDLWLALPKFTDGAE
jgi:hypothetical protein